MAVRLIRHVGFEPGAAYVQDGRARLLSNIGRFNEAARRGDWFALCDLDCGFAALRRLAL